MADPAAPARAAPVLLTLQRGLRLLEAVAEAGGRATAKGLAARIGVKPGTCYQLLHTLMEERYVIRLPGGTYALGERTAALQDSLHARLTPAPELLSILRRLQHRVRETAYLSGWYGDRIAIQWCIEAQHTLHVRSWMVGYSRNAHARASGKAILAHLPERRVRAHVAAHGMPRLTARTITGVEALIDDLIATRRRGYALDLEEQVAGACAIGAAYFDARGFPLGAYVVAAPSGRFERRREEFAGVLREAAAQASARLGYGGPFPPSGSGLPRPHRW